MSSTTGLVDYLGRPVKSGQLRKTLALPNVTGVRPTWYASVANSLTPDRLGTIILGVDQNDMNDYLTLAEEMEERDLHYRSVLSTRKLAVSGLEIAVEAATDEPRDVEIADFVRTIVDRDITADLVKGQLDALGKGFSVSEIMWDRDGARWEPSGYEWRDQRHFRFDRATGQVLRLRDEADTTDGIEMPAYKFVQHRPKLKMGLSVRAGLARLAAAAYMIKSYTLKDWLAFVEVYGMPLRIGKYADSADDAQKAELLSAVARIGVDAAAIIPESMIIEFVESGGGKSANNDKIFSGLADYVDSQVSKGVLGQTMTADDGSSLSQANVHNDVRGDIQLDDAKQLAATLRRDLVQPCVDLNFAGPHEVYPNLRFVIEEPEDLEALARSLPEFIDRGLRVQSSIILDKFSIDEAEEGAEVLQPKSSGSALPAGGELPDSDNNGDSDNAQQNQARVVSKLLARVEVGEALTEDQKNLLNISLMAGRRTDTIERLANDELDGWHPVMSPLLDPILAAAESAGSYDEFVASLPNVLSEMDSDKLLERLAIAMFKARGLGDGTDKP
jgi:phage gp29-like protein